MTADRQRIAKFDQIWISDRELLCERYGFGSCVTDWNAETRAERGAAPGPAAGWDVGRGTVLTTMESDTRETKGLTGHWRFDFGLSNEFVREVFS